MTRATVRREKTKAKTIWNLNFKSFSRNSIVSDQDLRVKHARDRETRAKDRKREREREAILI